MTTEHKSPDLEAHSLVSQVINTWRSGNDPNAQAVLDQHPHLCDHESLVLDLAYEEYCLRREAGERVVLSTYCDRFPTVHKSLRILLATHECFDEASDLENKPADVPWPETETRFLGFYLIREIGRGAFARVYLATEPSLGDRLVVVKIARHGGGEAETLGRLTHRNIVPVYSVQEDEATHLTAICMPYLGRGTLLKAIDEAYETDVKEHRVKEHRARLFIDVGKRDAILDAIPEAYTRRDPLLEQASLTDGTVFIIAQLADALAHAHDAGICHRDLKPSNILLAPSGCPLLLDFNLSSDQRLQRTLVGGTFPYMPPEQLRGVLVDDCAEAILGDPRSDVFSLGVILYELLTGRLPFGDQRINEPANVGAFRIMAKQEEGCEPLATLNPAVGPDLVEIVGKCLQLEPENRYQTAQELASHLRSYLTRAARLKRWAHRRRFLIASAAAGFGLVAAAAGAELAMRPPYAQRRYQAGIRAFQNGELAQAIECFSDAHQARPNAYQPLFARGQTLVDMGQFDEAATELKRVYSLAPQGITAAWAGYAFQRCSLLIPATYYYSQALNEHGHETTAVLNNLGHVFRNRENFKSAAIDYLTRATRLNPKCQAAYLNRAYVYNRYGENVADDGTPYWKLAVTDAKFAATLGPHKAQTSYLLAMVHWAHNDTPQKDEIILDNLRQAIDHGYDRNALQNGSGLDEYSKRVMDYHQDVVPTPLGSPLVAPPHSFPPLSS